MNSTNKLLRVVFIAVTAIITSCSKDNMYSPTTNATEEKSASGTNGRLYTMTNDANQNAIVEFTETSTGVYAMGGTFNSGGKGTGAPLGSQGALAIDNTGSFLYAVNAGDNTISSFKINSDGSLTLKHTVDSKGTIPVSLTLYNSWLYVVNYGTDDIDGFTVGSDGSFTHIQGSKHSLSATGCQPAEIKFRPDGSNLYVTEKATNEISSYPIDNSGVAGARVSFASDGQTPFGFDFGSGMNLIVADAYGGATNAAAATSYKAGTSGKVTVITEPVPNNQTATCWVAVTSDKHYALTTNTESNTVSIYKVTTDGTLSLFQQVATTTGAAPADIVVKGHYAYTVNQTGQSIGEFQINGDGTLTSLGEIFGLAAGASGLVSN